MAMQLQNYGSRVHALQQTQQRPAALSIRSPAQISRQRRRCVGASRRQPPTVRAEAEAAGATASDALPIERSGNAFKAVKDIEAIKKVLPHRFPFLLVDRVVECEIGKYAVGYKNITVNDQFFPGHFPERAIMPGVLQVEAMAQLGGICMLDPEGPSKDQFFFGGIEKCRFKKPVVPGDTLMMRVDILKYNKRYGIVKAAAKVSDPATEQAYVGPDVVCEAELTLAMGS